MTEKPDEGEEIEPAEVVARKRNVEQAERDIELAELAALIEQEPFRDYVWRLLERLNVYSSQFDRNAIDMARRCAWKDAGVMIINDLIEANPRGYVLLMEKAHRQQHEEADARRRAAIRKPKRP